MRKLCMMAAILLSMTALTACGDNNTTSSTTDSDVSSVIESVVSDVTSAVEDTSDKTEASSAVESETTTDSATDSSTESETSSIEKNEGESVTTDEEFTFPETSTDAPISATITEGEYTYTMTLKDYKTDNFSAGDSVGGTFTLECNFENGGTIKEDYTFLNDSGFYSAVAYADVTDWSVIEGATYGAVTQDMFDDSGISKMEEGVVLMDGLESLGYTQNETWNAIAFSITINSSGDLSYSGDVDFTDAEIYVNGELVETE